MRLPSVHAVGKSRGLDKFFSCDALYSPAHFGSWDSACIAFPAQDLSFVFACVILLLPSLKLLVDNEGCRSVQKVRDASPCPQEDPFSIHVLGRETYGANAETQSENPCSPALHAF